MTNTYKYQAYTVSNFRKIPQVEKHLSKEEKFEIEVVGNVLPFKVNNYVINELINWEDPFDDPIFILTFPHRKMLKPQHFEIISTAIKNKISRKELKEIVNKIRLKLNPHPAGQMKYNIPEIQGVKLTGVQHKYDHTVLFFPSHGQTCHAYCTFCFRWPQFVGIDELKFAMRETELLIKYLQQNEQITDILFTGGDPMVMSAKRLKMYIEPLIKANIPNLKTIRIGTKSLSYWPYKFISEKDTAEVLELFEKVVSSGIQLAFMAHFNHPKELNTTAVRQAIHNINKTGAIIRTQSPIMKNINDTAKVWSDMWQKQIELGCIPYYMFLARDTGAQHYFAVELSKAWDIFRKAYSNVSGLGRTVRGPSMSAAPGKVQILGVSEIKGEKVFVLRFLQGRNKNWVHIPFFAKFDEHAIWLDELIPAFGEDSFFFEEEMANMYIKKELL